MEASTSETNADKRSFTALQKSSTHEGSEKPKLATSTSFQSSGESAEQEYADNTKTQSLPQHSRAILVCNEDVEAGKVEGSCRIKREPLESLSQMHAEHFPGATCSSKSNEFTSTLEKQAFRTLTGTSEPVPQIITSYESLEGVMKSTSMQDHQLANNCKSGENAGKGLKSCQSKSKSSSHSSAEAEANASNSSISSNNDSIDGQKAGPPKVITTISADVSPAVKSQPIHLASSSRSRLRRGKWTVEEEAYVARVIQDFNSGFLDAPAGTTLRTYLSEKLQCDPMRITKKFTGDACIGKRVFHPAVRSPSNAAAIDKAQSELESLEKRWRRRLEMQQKESAKKAQSHSSAAFQAARGQINSSFDVTGHLTSDAQENVVARTASWLDRAKSVLRSTPSTGRNVVITDKAEAERSEVESDIQTQMKEVQRLIHEGPLIEQTSAGLPDILDQVEAHRSESPLEDQDLEPERASSPPIESDIKRMRTAEDAEALVGFLRSVRASAMSGQEF